MTHRIAERLLGDSQQLVLMLGLQARLEIAALEGASDAPRHRRAVAKLPEGNLESGAAFLTQPQRHHRAARFRQAVAGEVTDPVQDAGQLGVLALAWLELLRGTELHENSGERLRQTIMDFLADARA